MSEQRAAYWPAHDLEAAEQQYRALVRRALGPRATVRIDITMSDPTPEPATRAGLTVVGDWLTLRQAGVVLGRSWDTLRRWGHEGRCRIERRDHGLIPPVFCPACLGDIWDRSARRGR